MYVSRPSIHRSIVNTAPTCSYTVNEVFFDSGFSANSKINSDGFAEKMEYTLTVGGQEMDLKLLHQKTLVQNYNG